MIFIILSKVLCPGDIFIFLVFILSPLSNHIIPSSFKLNQLLYKLHDIRFINFTLGIGSFKWIGSPFFLVTIVMNTLYIVTNIIPFNKSNFSKLI